MKFDDFETAIATYGVHPDKWPPHVRDDMLSLVAVNRKTDDIIRTYARIEAGLEKAPEPELPKVLLGTMQDNVMEMIEKDADGLSSKAESDQDAEESAFKYFISIAASFILGLVVANSEAGRDLEAQIFGVDELTVDEVAFSALGYETPTVMDDEEGENNENN